MTSSDDPARAQDALWFHQYPKPGKIETLVSKPIDTIKKLTLAYSPGVAEPALEISRDGTNVWKYTGRGNLVGVVTNGTAVLGLGAIGPLAAKPVMEGKAALFKCLADIDCFDIEFDEQDPEKLADHIIALEPTFSAINLEDIRAPDCFIIEKLCQEKMGVPVFHDDQHGTAIVTAAGMKNALRLAGKDIKAAKLVVAGCGAAGIACVLMLLEIGFKPENIFLFDENGSLTKDRASKFPDGIIQCTIGKRGICFDTAFKEADVFLGVSTGNIVHERHIASMAETPIVFALANPIPEIDPALVLKAREDAIVATGRSDYPDQVNNVLCFPFIFRGALDARATTINDTMKLACVDALANLAHCSDGESELLNSGQILPSPFDPRLAVDLPKAVYDAAIASGAARSQS